MSHFMTLLLFIQLADEFPERNKPESTEELVVVRRDKTHYHLLPHRQLLAPPQTTDSLFQNLCLQSRFFVWLDFLPQQDALPASIRFYRSYKDYCSHQMLKEKLTFEFRPVLKICTTAFESLQILKDQFSFKLIISTYYHDRRYCCQGWQLELFSKIGSG